MSPQPHESPDGNIRSWRLDRLTLENFRCFSQLEIDFHNGLTVLVAANGGGKTAVLDAAAIVWRLLIDTLQTASASQGIARSDIRRVLSGDRTMELIVPVTLRAEGVLGGTPGTWIRALASDRPHARTTFADAMQLKDLGAELRASVQNNAEGNGPPPLLPIIAYYGTGRLWNQSKLTAGKRLDLETSRISGYTDSLVPSSSFRVFESWLRGYSMEAQRELATNRASPHKTRERLAAIRGAVEVVLEPSGWLQLEWDFVEDVAVASHADYGRLPIASLSDGIRMMIGLVSDLAHRCVRLNPHLGREAAQQTPGIVLIDEVDMHLHPHWQQQVIGGLRKAFPAVQFIVTTHSPQVLSTVQKECIRMLSVDEAGVGMAETPTISPLARESGDALAYIFGTDLKPMHLQLNSGTSVVDAIHKFEQYARAGRERDPGAEALLRELTDFGVEIPESDLDLWRFMAKRKEERA